MQLLSAFSLFLLVPGSTPTATEKTNIDSLPSDNSTPQAEVKSISHLEVSRRNEAIALQLSEDSIQGVRKMSTDEGEKFFLDDWRFVDDSQGRSPRSESAVMDHEGFSMDKDADQRVPWAFLPRSHVFEPASPASHPHGLEESSVRHRSPLEARDFKCPTDTQACTNIHRSDRCCGLESTCELVKDTGLGDVGCCANGKTCSGQVGSCQRGYTACSQALGGGCCIPGYACVAGGCAYVSEVTVTIHSSLLVTTKTFFTTPPTSTSPIPSRHSTNTGDGLLPPALPTSRSTSTGTTTSRFDICPTGFYACSAVYHGGCCQTGRDCDTTSCPTISSTTFTSNGVTLVVPATASTNSRSTKTCANGWFQCADTAGGGCCPRGYACGSSCTATAARSTVAKEEVSGGTPQTDGGILLGAIMLCLWIWW